jgi:mycothiol synthase
MEPMSQLAMLLPSGPEHFDQAATVSVRTATAADAEAVARVLASAFPTEVWDEARVRRDLTEAPDVLAVFVAELDGEVVATASARSVPERFPDQGYLHWVGADPQHGGRGLGRAVVTEVLRYLGSEGLWPVVLETDDERLPAISTYLALGFVPLYLGDDHQHRWSSVFTALHRARKESGSRQR